MNTNNTTIGNKVVATKAIETKQEQRNRDNVE